MLPGIPNGTGKLLADAHETRQRTQTAVTELLEVQKKVSETVELVRLWRYFDYDLTALKFLDGLDLRRAADPVAHTGPDTPQ